MPDLSDTIEQVAAEPQSVTIDGQTAANPDVTKIIEADRYLKGRTAAAAVNPSGGATSPWNMLRPARARTEGTG